MAAKAKTEAMDFRQLEKELSEGTIRQLYFFYGEESYLKEYYLGRLKAGILTNGMETFNFHVLKEKEVTPKKLEEVVDCLPMMAERTFILVTDFDLFQTREAEREQYRTILSQLPDYCCLVFFYDLVPFKWDARTKLAATVKKSGVLVDFARSDEANLVAWMQRRFRALGRDIDKGLAREMIFLCGDLMHTLIGEIEKVGAYAKQTRITRGDIEAVVTVQLDAVIYQMTNAIGEGKFDHAAAVLGELYQMQEPPMKILAALGKQLRQIYCAALALERGKNPTYVAELWDLKSFRAERIFYAARRFGVEWCRRSVVRCAQTDFAMKSTGRENQELLTELLLELAAPMQKRGTRW